MSLFAVIKVDQCYDYVENAICLETFQTNEEAEKYVVDIKNNVITANRKRLDYINDFVEKIEIPMTYHYPPHSMADYNGWMEFVRYYFGENRMTHMQPANFKSNLRQYLHEHQPKLEGFNPPPAKHGWNNLFVVEIKVLPIPS